jgi:UrcA family protein
MTAATLTTRSNRFTSGRLAVLAGCLLAGTLSVAQAAPPAAAAHPVRTIVVNYSDLNLSTDEGTFALYQRISTAARRVCPLDDTRALAQSIASDACRAAAVARAVAAVNSPQLAALYAGRTNRG